MNTILTSEVVIRAPARTVFEMFTDGGDFMRWMAVEAEIEPWVGGRVWWRHSNGDACAGYFEELVPHSRIVFTYGWERADVGIPVGSTRVEVELTERGGVTTLRVVHSGLGEPAARAHSAGWGHYLSRLATLAAGADPGPDPWADRRVPSAADMRFTSTE